MPSPAPRDRSLKDEAPSTLMFDRMPRIATLKPSALIAAALLSTLGCASLSNLTGDAASDAGTDVSHHDDARNDAPDGRREASRDTGTDVGEFAGSCSTSPVFADNFSAVTPPGTGYTTINGSWVRGAGSFTATYPGGFGGERAYALIGGDYADFDITIRGHSIGGDGFGLVYGTSGIGDGYAILVHPNEYLGVYYKQLIPGMQDVTIGASGLPSLPPESPFTLRVQRTSGTVTITLSGPALASDISLVGDEVAGSTGQGRLGLILSLTTDLRGAVFTDLTVSTAACVESAPGDAGHDAMQDAELADSEPGDAGVDTGTVDGSPPPARMSAPSYSGSTWTAASLTNDETFSNLDNWNYGYTDYNASGGSGAYSPWGASGTAPYWGSSGAGDGSLLDYDLPGNVFQTSTGADTFLYSTYGPQTFNPHGSGVSLVAHYTGARQWNTEGSGELSATWTSGVINSYNKISFPSGAHTSCFVQINAQMMGNAGWDNGAWNTLAFLGQESEGREIALQGTGLTSQSPNIITSSLQSPNLLLDSYTSASDLSTGYHIYGMELADETVTIYLDNVQVGTASSGTSGPYFLLMDGAIASGTYGAAPANNVDMTMNIAEVQVYQK